METNPSLKIQLNLFMDYFKENKEIASKSAKTNLLPESNNFKERRIIFLT